MEELKLENELKIKEQSENLIILIDQHQDEAEKLKKKHDKKIKKIQKKFNKQNLENQKIVDKKI